MPDQLPIIPDGVTLSIDEMRQAINGDYQALKAVYRSKALDGDIKSAELYLQILKEERRLNAIDSAQVHRIEYSNPATEKKLMLSLGQRRIEDAIDITPKGDDSNAKERQGDDM